MKTGVTYVESFGHSFLSLPVDYSFFLSDSIFSLLLVTKPDKRRIFWKKNEWCVSDEDDSKDRQTSERRKKRGREIEKERKEKRDIEREWKEIWEEKDKKLGSILTLKWNWVRGKLWKRRKEIENSCYWGQGTWREYVTKRIERERDRLLQRERERREKMVWYNPPSHNPVEMKNTEESVSETGWREDFTFLSFFSLSLSPVSCPSLLPSFEMFSFQD